MKHIKNFVLITEENIKKMGYDGLKFKSDQSYEGNFNSWNYVIYNKNIIKKNKYQNQLKYNDNK